MDAGWGTGETYQGNAFQPTQCPSAFYGVKPFCPIFKITYWHLERMLSCADFTNFLGISTYLRAVPFHSLMACCLVPIILFLSLPSLFCFSFPFFFWLNSFYGCYSFLLSSQSQFYFPHSFLFYLHMLHHTHTRMLLYGKSFSYVSLTRALRNLNAASFLSRFLLQIGQP